MGLRERTPPLQLTVPTPPAVNFDAHIYQTFAVLYAGGSIVTTRNNGETDIEYIMQTVQQQGVTLFGTVG